MLFGILSESLLDFLHARPSPLEPVWKVKFCCAGRCADKTIETKCSVRRQPFLSIGALEPVQYQSQSHRPSSFLCHKLCNLRLSAFHFFSPLDISTKDVGIAGFAPSAHLVVLMRVTKHTG